jgi:hypothetical protein
VRSGPPGQRGVHVLVTGVGRALGGIFFLVGRARGRGRKALHPRGGVRPGLVHRRGCSTRTGVAWIDEPGTDRVLVRLSRATGFPDVLPDIGGLALRVPITADRPGDLLLATAGVGPVGRFLVRPTRRRGHLYSSVMPYRSPVGPLLLAAFPLGADGTQFELAWSGRRGGWSPFAVLEVPSGWDDAPDTSLTFDPVLNPLPGLPSYPWAAQLRRFPYAASRRSRGADL